MVKKVTTTKEKLLRVVRGLQLLQRSIDTKSSLFKACDKALRPLLDEQAKLPPDVLEPPPAA